MKFKKHALYFLLGGGSYVALELLWRRYSHISMFLTGGACFLLLGKLNKTEPRLPLIPRCFVGAGIITMMEFLAGLLFNRNYTVWDYRDLPLNYHGQICLPFFLLWVPISLGAMALYEQLEKRSTK